MEPSADLLRRAEQGDVEAQLALGHHYAEQNAANRARGWFARAAKAGSAPAMRELAIHLLTHPPIVERDGLEMIETAAAQGDAKAAYICGLLCAQNLALEQRWEAAIACLREAAGRELDGADAELALLGAEEATGGLDATKFVATLEREDISQAPRIQVARNFLRPELCDWLSRVGRPRLERASVYDPATGGQRVEHARSNSHVTFDALSANFVIMVIRDRVAAITGRPLTSLEQTALLHYEVGESFAPHFDFLDPAIPAYAREIVQQGQRIATLLVYLNDDYEGGETEFLKLGLRHRGHKGDALLFWNVDGAGVPEQLSFHAGRAPTSGEKWLLSQWVRGDAPLGVRKDATSPRSD